MTVAELIPRAWVYQLGERGAVIEIEDLPWNRKVNREERCLWRILRSQGDWEYIDSGVCSTFDEALERARASAEKAHHGPRLTQEQLAALPTGTAIVVTWSGGNGPHKYELRHDHGQPAASASGVFVGIHADGDKGDYVTRDIERTER